MANPSSTPSAYNRSGNTRFSRLLWQGKFGPAFWTMTGLISITVNIIPQSCIHSPGEHTRNPDIVFPCFLAKYLG